MLTSNEAISCLVGANGDVKLATVRARVFDPSCTEPLLLTVIASDPNAPSILYRQIQVLMVLQAFGSFKHVQHAFIEKIPQMSPDTVSRTYTSMLKSLSDLTASGAQMQQDNPLRTVLAALPPEIADAVERLMIASPNLQSQADTMNLLASEEEDEQDEATPETLRVNQQSETAVAA